MNLTTPWPIVIVASVAMLAITVASFHSETLVATTTAITLILNQTVMALLGRRVAENVHQEVTQVKREMRDMKSDVKEVKGDLTKNTAATEETASVIRQVQTDATTAAQAATVAANKSASAVEVVRKAVEKMGT